MVPIKSHIQSNGGDEIGILPSANLEGTPSKTSEVDSPTCNLEIRNRDPCFHFITCGFPELRTPNNSEIGSRNFHLSLYVFPEFRTPNRSEVGTPLSSITTLFPSRGPRSEHKNRKSRNRSIIPQQQQRFFFSDYRFRKLEIGKSEIGLFFEALILQNNLIGWLSLIERPDPTAVNHPNPNKATFDFGPYQVDLPVRIGHPTPSNGRHSSRLPSRPPWESRNFRKSELP